METEMSLNSLWTEYTENSLQPLIHLIHRELHIAINKTPHTNHSTHSLDNARNTKAASWCMQKIPTLIPLYHCPQFEKSREIDDALVKESSCKNEELAN